MVSSLKQTQNIGINKLETKTMIPIRQTPPRRRDRVNKLLPRDIEYCVYMIETYEENFEVLYFYLLFFFKLDFLII